MRVMVLTDGSFAQREHLLLTRLEIGLADEGTAVIHAVPRSSSLDAANAFSSTVLRYDDTPTPLGRFSRARQLLVSAAEQLDSNEVQVDVIHVFGARSWSLGQALARLTGAALVLEVWRADLVEPAVRRARAIHGGARGTGSRPRVGLLTSSDRIGHDLRRAAPALAGAGIGVAPWGIPPGEGGRPPIEDAKGSAIAVSILADGDDSAEVRTLLEGLSRVARRDPRVLVFLDGAAADRPGVWRAARRLGLLERLTAVADMEGRREPVLQTDILAVPDTHGVCRTLPLAAMADGVAIVARPDPYHADWLNQTTARLVGSAKTGTPEEWEAALTSCITDGARTAALRAGARSLVRQQRTLSSYVGGVRRLYEAVAGAEANPPTTVLG